MKAKGKYRNRGFTFDRLFSRASSFQPRQPSGDEMLFDDAVLDFYIKDFLFQPATQLNALLILILLLTVSFRLRSITGRLSNIEKQIKGGP